MLREIDNLAPYAPRIQDIHLGGGTPSHLDWAQFQALCLRLEKLVDLSYLNEFAMEIDPRTVTQDDLRHYAVHGVSRISFGVQDFDLRVQEAINRVQPPQMIEHLLEVRHHFKGVNFDLLYGLPHQTHETLRLTVERTIQMRPERITLLKYCHAPEVRRHMKLINASELPKPEELGIMFVDAAQRLMDAGYLWIGLDHFALPSDSLCHRIGRTFNGFSSGTTAMIGLGPTSTSAFERVYAQAHYDLNEYYAAVKRGEFPILRGYRLTQDDVSRRYHIFNLLCHQKTDVGEGGYRYELEQLGNWPELVQIEHKLPEHISIKITDYGRVLLRHICKAFDNRDIEPEHHKIAQLNMVRRREAHPAHQPS